MDSHLVAVGILIVGNAPIYALLGKLLFHRWESFKEGMLLVLLPDVLYFSRGNVAVNWRAMARFFTWTALCILVVFAEYNVVDAYVLR